MKVPLASEAHVAQPGLEIGKQRSPTSWQEWLLFRATLWRRRVGLSSTFELPFWTASFPRGRAKAIGQIPLTIGRVFGINPPNLRMSGTVKRERVRERSGKFLPKKYATPEEELERMTRCFDAITCKNVPPQAEVTDSCPGIPPRSHRFLTPCEPQFSMVTPPFSFTHFFRVNL